MTENRWTRVAQDLCAKGYAFFPLGCDQNQIGNAQGTFKEFVARRAERGDAAAWQLRRQGEAEADLGLIQRTDGSKDLKSFFHYDASLKGALEQSTASVALIDYTFLEAQASLYKHVTAIGYNIIGALEGTDEFTEMLSDLYQVSAAEPESNGPGPYDSTTLRSLYYPDSPAQTDARARIDQSLITIHLGDKDGELRALKSKDDPEGVAISPPPGYGVVFFGVKALWASGGKYGPLWHRSTTKPGQDRYAFVHFGHIPLFDGYQVKDAENAFNYWKKHCEGKNFSSTAWTA